LRTEANGTIAVGMTLQELGQSVISGRVKAAELVNGYLQRIAARNSGINAYLSVTSEDARRTAEDLDAAARRGDPLGPLAGVPVAIKDVIAIEGMTATAGSRILEGYKPPYTATAVRRLKEAGAVVLGKLNCDEFAMGSSNENSAYGVVRNPAALDRVPGGSSGGSAAAVAAELAAATLGTDTGGSIRQPASFCGVVGVLPTYGRVSRYGLIAFASSLDRIGPFARTVEDDPFHHLAHLRCGHGGDYAPGTIRQWLRQCIHRVEWNRLQILASLHGGRACNHYVGRKKYAAICDG